MGLIAQPITQMIQACGWIPLMWNWSSHYLSLRRNRMRCWLSLPLSLPGQPQSRELLKSWKGATEVEVMNRAARVTAEGKLPEWVQRWLSYRNQWEGTQWRTCAGGIPNHPTRMSKYLCRKMDFIFFFLCIWFASQVGKKPFTCERSGKGPKQSNKMMLRLCVKITAQLAATWTPERNACEATPSPSHFIPKTNVTFYQLCKD